MSSWVLRAAPGWHSSQTSSVSCLLRPSLLLSLAVEQRTRFSTSRTRCSSTVTATPSGPEGALAGVKILDLTRVLAGPFCTQILADYGADVIKVEHPKGGDDTRLWRDAGEKDFWKEGETTSLYFNTINRNKKSIAVNLKNARGRDLVLDLARQADIV
jgi:hypothetical protein